MVLPHDAGSHPLSGRLLAIGQLRDLALFLGTSLYVLGYLTWAIYAASVGLGVLPPLEGQYFLAGVLPLLILASVVAAFQVIRPLDDAVERQRAKRRSLWILGAGALCFYLPDVVGLFTNAPLSWEFAIRLVSVVLFYFALAFGVRGDIGAAIAQPLLRVVLPLACIVALAFYATRLFPLLARELGGPLPQCVRIDVALDAVSIETRVELGAFSSGFATERSEPLWLHFDGGGTLVLSRERGAPVQRALRVSADKVSAIMASDGCVVAQPVSG